MVVACSCGRAAAAGLTHGWIGDYVFFPCQHISCLASSMHVTRHGPKVCNEVAGKPALEGTAESTTSLDACFTAV